MRSKNLLGLHAARRKYKDNKQKVLQFLRQEKYSTSSILMKLLQLEYRSSICKVLRKMMAENLVKKHKWTGTIILWGITSNGLHHASDFQEQIMDWSYFEPSKIKDITLRHQLDVQQVHAACILKNINFTVGRLLGSREAQDKIPDGVFDIYNKKIALEVERHIKSKRRYDAILYDYLKAIDSSKYNHVLYVSPDEKTRDRVKKAFFSLKQITMYAGGRRQMLTINPELHLIYFDFISLQEVDMYLLRLQKILKNSL